MKSLKYVKLFESFVNEEFQETRGLNAAQSFLLHTMKAPDYADPSYKVWKEENKKFENALRTELSKFGVTFTFHAYNFGDNDLNFTFDFPEGFMSKVKRFFGFGKSKVQLKYKVKNLKDVKATGYSFDKTPENFREEVELSLGVDRRNAPKYQSYKDPETGDYQTKADISDIETNRSSFSEKIEVDTEDIQEICDLLMEVNPATKFTTAQFLVTELNDKLSSSFDRDRKTAETDPNYRFVVLNQIKLV